MIPKKVINRGRENKRLNIFSSSVFPLLEDYVERKFDETLKALRVIVADFSFLYLFPLTPLTALVFLTHI